MKKVTYLLLLMFATVLLTTSCDEDETLTPDDETVDAIISQDELIGLWNFVDFEIEGEIYNEYNIDCGNFTYIMNNELDFFMFESQIEVYGRNQDGIVLEYILNDDNIIINSFSYQSETTDNLSLELELLDYDKASKILKLKLGSNFTCYSEDIIRIKKIQGL